MVGPPLTGFEKVRSVVETAVVIFAARESPDVLLKTLTMANQSCGSTAQIDVIVNGNRALSGEIAARISSPHIADSEAGTQNPLSEPQPCSVLINVWDIEFGDKANAWNQYIHSIWSGERLAFFLDGNVYLNPNSISELERITMDDGFALAGTGVPTQGRSAKAVRDELLEWGGLHGSFCCIKGRTLQEIKSRNIRLPLSLYRVDSLMGALLGLGLAPQGQDWQKEKIAVASKASWTIDRWSWTKLSDIQSQFKRLLRQFKGGFEKRAFRHYLEVQKGLPEMMPETSLEMVTNHLRPQRFGWWAIRMYGVLSQFSSKRTADQLPRLAWSGRMRVPEAAGR